MVPFCVAFISFSMLVRFFAFFFLLAAILDAAPLPRPSDTPDTDTWDSTMGYES
jgi:hypothetical protein